MSTDYLTLKDAAERTGVSITTLRRLVRSGRLKTQRRANDRQPVRVTTEALTAAGLTVHASQAGYSDTVQADSQAVVILRERVSDLEQRLDAAQAEVSRLAIQAAGDQRALAERQAAYQELLSRVEMRALTTSSGQSEPSGRLSRWRARKGQ